MRPRELQPFGVIQISEQERQKLAEIPHKVLLEEYFNALTGELDTKGNTPRFQLLRQEYARKMLVYWQVKWLKYQQAQKEGIVRESQELVSADEKLSTLYLEPYESDDQRVLLINRKTETERDEVSITASLDSGIDEFFRPPTIKSDIKSDPDEPSDIHYKVVFRRGKISTFERTRLLFDNTGKNHYIKDTRVIDCSTFGVEL
ncbi:MAG: hypothetical protein A2857_02140 [Candidatus Levybacteria bacterium RIFCSPHIGHO2_01_FULL_36_15]|nr:MAG: hypothetical protein A2857_02140 [Candidatus Levybacteria bacterium RIFCSPHIGHO2_01_FULL_36_15]OGH38775.1 MAG: hypothetical protein A2905_04425 [Candidatus Levybacteria bacterium RIFCSPLOWO2_01_FULL_36_10]